MNKRNKLQKTEFIKDILHKFQPSYHINVSHTFQTPFKTEHVDETSVKAVCVNL